MQLDQFLHQGQPDATALMRASACVFDPVEPIKKQRDFIKGDARTGVAHAQFCGEVSMSHRDGDFPVKSELEGVGQQVENDLLPHRPVHEHRLAKRRAINAEFQPGLFAGRAEVAGKVSGEVSQGCRLIRRADPTGLDPGEIQQGVHEALQAQPVAVNNF